MSDLPKRSSSNSKPIHRSLSPQVNQARSPPSNSESRAASIARLASSPGDQVGSRSNRISSVPGSGNRTPLAGAEGSGHITTPASSALAAALREGDTPVRYGTPPRRESSSGWVKQSALDPTQKSLPQTQYGSFDARSIGGDAQSTRPPSLADPEVIKKHLARPSTLRTSQHDDDKKKAAGSRGDNDLEEPQNSREDDVLASSLQLHGGDVTRDIVRWQENAEADAETRKSRRRRRSTSFLSSIHRDDEEGPNYKSIIEPGGFRRDHLRRRLVESSTSTRPPLQRRHTALSTFGTNVKQTLMEFLTVYTIYDEEYEDRHTVDEEGAPYSTADQEDDEFDEQTALLSASTHSIRQKSSSWGTALKLLKSFVGTGVLFLPRAFLNGGMLFSATVLIGVSLYCFVCFLTLVACGSVVPGEYGDIGKKSVGMWLYVLIQVSLVASQMGFVATYLAFTSKNLHDFVKAVSNNYAFDVKYFILIQTLLLLPVSLYRKLDHLKFFIVLADIFIFLGLFYIAAVEIGTLRDNNGMADIVLFNPESWTLFLGTAIFTFEGIGLVLPLRQEMRHQEDFPKVLGGVMVFITILFVGMGALSYAAYGSATQAVVLSNLPQNSKLVNGVQFLYSLAILLSVPLQLIVAVDVVEKSFFSGSGKTSHGVKWAKNIERFLMMIFSALLAWAGAGQLDKFVALTGSFACIPLVSVYPVSFLKKSSRSDTNANDLSR